MRVFSKTTLRFDDPDGQEPSVVVRAHDVGATVPDWVPKSNMFKLASADGTLEVLESRQDAAKAEKKAADESNVKPASEKAKAAEGTDLAGTKASN